MEIDSTPIYINDFCSEIAKLNQTNNKIHFVENYAKCKTTMDEIDTILDGDDEDFSGKTLEELLEMLKDFDDAITNNVDFTVKEFKKMQSLVKVTENLINNDAMRVVEINDNF